MSKQSNQRYRKELEKRNQNNGTGQMMQNLTQKGDTGFHNKEEHKSKNNTASNSSPS